MKKVYCKDCKKFEEDLRGGSRCNVIVDNWYSPKAEVSTPCMALNARNDCSFYDPKLEEND